MQCIVGRQWSGLSLITQKCSSWMTLIWPWWSGGAWWIFGKKLYFWFVLFLYFQIHTVSQSRIWPHDHLLCIIWSDFWGIRRLIRRRSTQLQDLGQIWQHSRFFVGNYTLSLLTSRTPTQHNTGSRMFYILWSLWPKPNFDQDVKWCIFITSTKCFSLFNPWAVPFEGLRPWK